jgi:hypothetical protein
MAIRALSRHEFYRLRSVRTTMAHRLTDRAIEWFIDDTQTVLGAIAYDERDLDWSIAILGRDTHGQLRALDAHKGIDDLEHARQRLVKRMAVVVAVVDGGSLPPAAA